MRLHLQPQIRTTTMEQIPDPVRHLLELALPRYREARRRWPLWTYDRHELPDGFRAHRRAMIPEYIQAKMPLTWWRCRSWTDRLAFSPASLVPDVYGDALAALEDGDVEDWTVTPTGAVKKTGVDSSEPQRVVPLPNLGNFPWLGLARLLAVRLQLDREIPEAVPEPPPDPSLQTGFIDDTDLQEVGRTLVDVLLRGDGRGSQEPVSLLERMRACNTGDGDEGTRPEVAVEFCDGAGLLPSRQGGAKSALSDRYLAQLREEATEITSEIRDFEPGEEMVRCLDSLLRSDPNFEPTVRERERPMRILRGKLPPDRAWERSTTYRQLFTISFPFLQLAELNVVHSRTSPSKYELTPAQAANRLVASRLPYLEPESDYKWLSGLQGRNRRKAQEWLAENTPDPDETPPEIHPEDGARTSLRPLSTCRDPSLRVRDFQPEDPNSPLL